MVTILHRKVYEKLKNAIYKDVQINLIFLNFFSLVEARCKLILIRLSSFSESQLLESHFGFLSGNECNDDICHETTPGNCIAF